MPLSLPGSQLHREVGETREDDDNQPQVMGRYTYAPIGLAHGIGLLELLGTPRV